MTAREWWEVKWIQWIAVQENWSTVVSSADTVNIVWGWTVTDVWGVATINIPYWAEWYREDVPAGSATYTFVNEPATATSFLIFTDSGTLLFSGIDYTYNASTHTVTFLSLDTNEAAYIWVAHASVVWGNVWDMVKAVYDPNNVQRNVYDYTYFINTPTIWAGVLTIEKNWTSVGTFWANDTANKSIDITVPTTVAELTDESDYVKVTDMASVVEWPANAVDWNIAVFDWATWKIIKDSWFNIQYTETHPTWDNVEVYYDNGTIYLYKPPVSVILTESWNTLTTENNDPLILEN
jgi:hypothetical protein